MILTQLARIRSLFIKITLPLGLFLNLISGGYIWSADLTIQILAITFFTITVIFLLVTTKNEQFHWSGLEWALLFGILILILAFIFSQQFEMSFLRTANWIALVVIFYLTRDILRDKRMKSVLINSLLLISGLVLLVAAMEISTAYRTYWSEAGNFPQLPPQPYRVVGILGHPNALAGFANVMAPLAIIYCYMQRKNPVGFSVGTAWLVMYAFMMLFSSSRGGLLGAAGWVGVLIVYVFILKKPFKTFFELSRRNRLNALLGISFGVLIMGLLIWWTWVGFISPRLAGASAFSGRTEMWNMALALFRISPWLGIGPGGLGMGVFQVTNTIPPLYWPSHFHNLGLNTLAEIGILGLLTGMIIFIWIVIELIQNLKKSGTADQPWILAGLAALMGFMAQNVVDDLTYWMSIMVPLVMILALSTQPQSDTQKNMRMALQVLWVPLLCVIGISGYYIWGSLPFSTALNRPHTTWQVLGESAETSLDRLPGLTFFHDQAALAYALSWSDHPQTETLLLVEDNFEEAIELEPQFSLFRANLAVTQYLQGQFNPALESINVAVNLAPNEPSYWLIQGRIYEGMQDENEATESYLQALILSPSWVDHPFWNTSIIRREALDQWINSSQQEVQGDTFWEQAERQLQTGNNAHVAVILANSRWMREDPVAIHVMEWRLALHTGSLDQAEALAWRIMQESNQLNLRSTNSFAVTYSLWIHHLLGLTIDLVPGYMQLRPEVGQFEVMNWLHTTLVQSGRCQEAGLLWQSWQIALHGGDIEGLEQPPECIPLESEPVS